MLTRRDIFGGAMAMLLLPLEALRKTATTREFPVFGIPLGTPPICLVRLQRIIDDEGYL